jgi:MFS family permease
VCRKNVKIRGGLVVFASRDLCASTGGDFTAGVAERRPRLCLQGACAVLMSVQRTRYQDARRSAVEPTPTGIALGIGATVMIITGLVAAMLPAADPGWRFAVIAVAVCGFAAVSLDQLALAGVAVIGSLIFNGFLEDRFGQLSWHGADDLWRLLLLVMVAAWGLAIGEGYRYIRDLQTRFPSEADGKVLSAPSIEEEKHGA